MTDEGDTGHWGQTGGFVRLVEETLEVRNASEWVPSSVLWGSGADCDWNSFLITLWLLNMTQQN
jgi:hypothetical protein